MPDQPVNHAAGAAVQANEKSASASTSGDQSKDELKSCSAGDQVKDESGSGSELELLPWGE